MTFQTPAKVKREFVSHFRDSNQLYSGLFNLDTRAVSYDKNDPDENDTTIEIIPRPNATVIAERLFHWTLFWPFFAVGFILKDGLIWVCEKVTDLILRAYHALLNSMFSKTL